jgi:para-aminobenzoate synthetase/4-amino-4-deoxychorismate lyase
MDCFSRRFLRRLIYYIIEDIYWEKHMNQPVYRREFRDLPYRSFEWLTAEPGLAFFETLRFDEANYRSYLFRKPGEELRADSLAELPAFFTAIEDRLARGFYLAGYFSYECGFHFEPTTAVSKKMPKPLAWFGVYDKPAIFNHLSGGWEGTLPDFLEKAISKDIDFTIDELEVAPAEAEYKAKISQIKDYIVKGDVYQVNYTGKCRFRFMGPAAGLYGFLRENQKPSYAAYISNEEATFLSFSPELFFRRDGDKISVRPMKGTARRGRTLAEDEAVAVWLQQDEKNRAENLMIVDLLRNDLGRVAVIGSVEVPQLFSIEKYQTLFQMTSTVTATLRPETDYYRLFRSIFPCGSVTGAPKIRAMQIIDELEPGPRGVYTGAVGFFTPEREARFNVAIRTVVLRDGRGEMGVGSGVVFDSEPAAEYEECKLKADFLTKKQPVFQLIETLLWQGEYPLLQRHLDRLRQSAAYFDYPFDMEEIKRRLLDFGEKAPKNKRHRVRLLFDRNGEVQLEATILPEYTEIEIAAIAMAETRTHSSDVFLYHKTTHRPLYDQALQQAAKDGLADLVFQNENGQVTEGAISNIFIELDGEWLTPPIECGLLNGVYRSHLLESRPEIVERAFTTDELRRADAIHLCNAVRGLRKVFLQVGK